MSQSPLVDPPQRGTLSLAYRRSVLALQSAVGWGSQQGETAEREGDGAAGPSRSATAGQGQYGSVLDLPPERRVPRPKAVKSQVRVEAKVWFANERTWISWLRVSVLLGSFSLALFNSSSFFEHHRTPDMPGGTPGPEIPRGPNPDTIRTFGLVYALISVCTLAWGLYSYQRRVTMIKNKWAGSFDDLIGPPVICVALFIAVLLNFIVRVQQFNAL